MSTLPWPQGHRGELYSPNLARTLAVAHHLDVLPKGLLCRNLDFPDLRRLIFKISPHESVDLGAKRGNTSTDGKTASEIDTKQILLLPWVRSLLENACRSQSITQINFVPSYPHWTSICSQPARGQFIYTCSDNAPLMTDGIGWHCIFT